MIRIQESDRLEALKKYFDQDRDRSIDAVYRCFRIPFARFAKRYTADEEIIVDCFQEAVIGLYENLAKNRISEWKATIKTYLFTIGKNKVLNAINRYRKPESLEQLSNIAVVADQDFIPNRDTLTYAFDQLGEACQDILIKFYYQRYSINAIMYDMQYKNENTVKAQKARCLQKLREIFKTMPSS